MVVVVVVMVVMVILYLDPSLWPLLSCFTVTLEYFVMNFLDPYLSMQILISSILYSATLQIEVSEDGTVLLSNNQMNQM